VSPERIPLLRPEDLRQVADLGLVARWIVEGTILGLHRSPFHGSSIEFAEYREYSPGDDLRSFDWKAYGRSDRTYIKKYHSETNLQAHLIVDASASMDYGDPTKFHYARCLAAALAYLLSLQHDAVGLHLVDSGIRQSLPPAMGPAHLRHLHGVLEKAEPASSTRLAPALHEVAEAAGRKGLAAIFSDLHDDERELLEGIRHLRFKGHEVIVFHLLDPSELDFEFDQLRDFEDLETGRRIEVHGPVMRREYLKRLERWLGELRSGCEGSKAEYVLVRTSDPFAAALAEYLHRRQARRAAP
jgi:uncharacterized protein (DUF58 family)